MERIFEYAIVRLTSQPHRGERFNIGLVVFKKDRLDIRLHPSPSLVRAVGADIDDVDWIPRLLVEADDVGLVANERCQRLGQYPGFAMSPIGWFEAQDEDQYEQRIATLRTEFVDRPRRPARSKKQSNLMRELRDEFNSHEIMGRKPEDVERHKVVSNVPVGPSGKLHIDFLVRNGAFHATETADFRRSSDAGVSELKGAALVSCTLQYAREQLGANNTHCYFVYAAPVVIEHAIRPALQLAQRYVDESFNMESAEDKRRYIDVILGAAGAPGLFG